MKHFCCQIFQKKKKKKKRNNPIFVCSMVKFSMTAILHRIFHLASQSMYIRVSYFLDTMTRHPKYVVMILLQAILPLKMFGII